VAALHAIGIPAPYSHQARAIAASLAGDDVVLTTPTASGKTLCFNAPVLDAILADASARALFLFPTKALSADQYANLHALIERLDVPIRTYTFDGDTPQDARRAVRDHGQIVITNPDMLHAAVLPQHTKWSKLFENLRYIVIDELHTYRGVFGSHMAHVLRRLLRIAAFHGARPQIIACSATIQNPVELAERLTGRTFTLVAESGAPQGEHHYVAYNPASASA
jgi:DEAD/DEAH box helicase domain-containing protein